MKKIYIIAPQFSPSALPPAQRVRLMLRYCRDNGFEATVFTVDPARREDPPDEWMNVLTGTDFQLVKTRCLDYKWTRKLGIGDLGLRMLGCPVRYQRD